MKNNYLLKISLNFLAVILLISLVATPIYFAKNAAQVAGVKSSSPYLLVSQIEKFPNLSFSQAVDTYSITFTKLGPSQAFLQILIINNPTDDTQTYNLQILAGQASLFFGEDLQNQITTITVPASASFPVSLFSSKEATTSSQSIQFTIKTN